MLMDYALVEIIGNHPLCRKPCVPSGYQLVVMNINEKVTRPSEPEMLDKVAKEITGSCQFLDCASHLFEDATTLIWRYKSI